MGLIYLVGRVGSSQAQHRPMQLNSEGQGREQNSAEVKMGGDTISYFKEGRARRGKKNGYLLHS